MSDIDEVRKTGGLVLDTLRRHSKNSGYTDAVEAAMSILDDPARRLEAVRALRDLAHVKALDDIYLEGVPGFEWPNMVSGLGATSAAYIEKHDPNAPAGRELGFSQEELLMLAKNSLPTHLHDPPAVSNSQFGIRLSWLTSMLQSSTISLVAKFVLLPVVVVLLVLLLVK